MSDWFNNKTKDIIIGGMDHLYRWNPDYVIINDRTLLPKCSPLFMKIDKDNVVEMSQEEKDVIIASYKRYKTRKEIFSEIFTNPSLQVSKMLNMVDEYPSFWAALEQGNIDVAISRLIKAKGKSSITVEEFDILKTIVETKI